MSIVPSPEFLQLQPVIAGRYSLERELGRGGMGVVFLARDVALDRPVAIKLLPRALAMQPELRERFLREARTAAQLSHPNIVPIHLVEEQGDVVFFVMMYVDGETLGQRVRRAGPMTPSQVTRVMQEVAWALAYAHGRGIVHRDVKPDNILLDKDSGRALVTDFGIARVANAGTLSGAGAIVGTMHYMSPEQASGEAVDGRSDLFSLGVTAFYALTGRLPFEGPNLPAVAMRIVHAEAPRIATLRPDVPPTLTEAVDRCLTKDPEWRVSSGEELAELVAAPAMASEVAPQIRYLFKAARELDPAMGFVTLALVFLPPVWRVMWQSDRGTVVALILMLGAPLVFALYAVVHSARHVVRAGLSHADIKRALERSLLAAREESATVGLWSDTTYELLERARKWTWLGHGSVMSALLAATIGGLTGGLAKYGLAAAAIGLGALGLLSYLAGFLVRRESRKQTPVISSLTNLNMGERFIGTRLFKLVFRLAGIGLDVGAQNQPPASERTEVFVASAAEEAFERLPADLKSRFTAVPSVVRKLQSNAVLLRKREEELRRAAAEAGGDGTIEAVRVKVRERLATAVSALESIRLELLRLDAGSGSPDDLTANLERARQIGVAVDAEVYGQSEVRRALATPT